MAPPAPHRACLRRYMGEVIASPAQVNGRRLTPPSAARTSLIAQQAGGRSVVFQHHSRPRHGTPDRAAEPSTASSKSPDGSQTSSACPIRLAFCTATTPPYCSPGVSMNGCRPDAVTVRAFVGKELENPTTVSACCGPVQRGSVTGNPRRCGADLLRPIDSQAPARRSRTLMPGFDATRPTPSACAGRIVAEFRITAARWANSPIRCAERGTVLPRTGRCGRRAGRQQR